MKNIFKREMKINFKSFFVWYLILISMFCIVFFMYPSITNSDSMKEFDKILNMFPQEILKAFNMDITSINSAFGWLKTEGFVFILLVTGCYSAILGSNILLKEENEKTIEYLNSLPINRKHILISKILVGILYVTLMILGIGIFNFIGLSFIETFSIKQFLLLSITPLFSSIVIFSLCFFMSTFTHKTKKMFAISLGIVFISYIFQIISGISETTEFFKYFSIFTLADTRNVIQFVEIKLVNVIISIFISTVLLILSMIKYQSKDLI